MKTYYSRKMMLEDLLKPNMVLAEIGVFTGEFTQWISNTLKPMTLYAIDPYICDMGIMGSGDENGFNMEHYNLETLHGFIKNRFYKSPNVDYRRETSNTFFSYIEDGSLDAIYIDGDHSFDAVRSDLENARHAVKEGGWIFGHDYALNVEKGNEEITHYVKEVVDEFCLQHGLELYALAEDGIVSFAIRNVNKYKICIVSLSDRVQLSKQIYPTMYTYAQKHNYDIELHDEILCNERHPSWSKIPALQKEIDKNKYDYIVWMDDDIYITDLEKPLSFFIDTYGFRKSNASIMVSSEVKNEISSIMNCGVMFFKGNTKSNELLNIVWDVGTMNTYLLHQFSWEQEAFNFNYKFGNREDYIIVPQPNFQTCARIDIDPEYSWKIGDFAAHLNVGNINKKLELLHLIKKLLSGVGLK